MDKGPKTQTTNSSQSTTYPQWTQDAGQNAFNLVAGMTNPFLKTPAYGVAGFTPDQTKAMDLARQQAMGAFTGSPTAVPIGATMQAATSQAAQYDGAQIGATDYRQFLNPYISDVVNATTNRARDQLRQTEADIGAKYAASGAFGGGREVLARGKAKENFDKTLQETTAGLMAQGYDAANALASANATMRQQSAEGNAQLRQQTALQNAENEQQARSTNLAYGLSAAQLADTMKDSNFARQNTALQQLLGTGALQQALAQGAMDQPWTNLNRLLGAVPAVYNTTQAGTKVEPKESSGPGLLNTVLGLGLKYATGGAV